MQARAKHEGMEWALTESFLESAFKQGARDFFGVELDDHGKLLTDNQQPEFFKQYFSN